MAIEGVVETPVESPVVVATPSTPVSGTPGTPHPDATKWDTERQGMLRDLQKERQRSQGFEQQFGSTKAELEQERKRIQALVGVNTPSAEAQEAEQIKARFAQLYPQLAELTAEDLKALRGWQAQAGQFEETTKAMWRDKARLMSSAVESRIAKELGGDLTPRQITNIRAAYVQAAETDPAFLARHEQGDLKLADEFATQFIEDWFEPARRKVTQQQVNQQRRVPSGRDRSAPGGPPLPKIDVNDPKAVEDFLIAGRKERGQAFGR